MLTLVIILMWQLKTTDTVCQIHTILRYSITFFVSNKYWVKTVSCHIKLDYTIASYVIMHTSTQNIHLYANNEVEDITPNSTLLY